MRVKINKTLISSLESKYNFVLSWAHRMDKGHITWNIDAMNSLYESNKREIRNPVTFDKGWKLTLDNGILS